MQQDRTVHLVEKALRGAFVRGDDALGVMRAMRFDMPDGRVEIVDDTDGKDRVQIFRGPVRVGRRTDPIVQRLCGLIAADLTSRRDQGVDDWGADGSPPRSCPPTRFLPHRRLRCAAFWR